MKLKFHGLHIPACLALLMFGSASRTIAQDGKLDIKVTPRQAYIFLDGRAMNEASKRHTFSLSAGDHKIDLANYGFTPVSKTVTISAGKTTNLEVSLNPVNTTVSGPFGAMTIEGAARDAVLLNGKTPEFFVGHGDEFDHDWVWKQELVVPPGTYQVTVQHEDKEVWSGSVNVPANQRVVIDIPKGVRKTVAWPRGEALKSIPRFTVGTASATVAVAKPTAGLSVTSAQINCGDSSQLKWTSTDAPNVQITPVGAVGASGEQAVQPKQTTSYQLTATGPGGTATSAATVNVNTAVQANLQLSPSEIQYKRVGDKVVEQGSSMLNWSASNASAVSIDPLGTVNPSGSQTLQLAPKKTGTGPVDETVTYTLNATNACGGTTTQTAALHIRGSIEPPPPVEIAMRSVYFQTAVPTRGRPKKGLLPSEQAELKSVAEAFKQFLANAPNARLILSGHADRRGANKYNLDLSERRVELAKNFLTEQGVPVGSIDGQGYGKEQNLTADQVKQLLEANRDLSDADKQVDLKKNKLDALVLANNRRVDIKVSTTGQQSLRDYPFKAEDFAKLIDRNGPKSAGEAQPAVKKEKGTK
jgi:outer membrane protein OmpA-like peptidoglycan-associated protein